MDSIGHEEIEVRAVGQNNVHSLGMTVDMSTVSRACGDVVTSSRAAGASHTLQWPCSVRSCFQNHCIRQLDAFTPARRRFRHHRCGIVLTVYCVHVTVTVTLTSIMTYSANTMSQLLETMPLRSTLLIHFRCAGTVSVSGMSPEFRYSARHPLQRNRSLVR